MPPEPGGCCLDAECAGGTCVDFLFEYCGGARPPEINTCRANECVDDAACGPGRACLPAGALGGVVSRCVTATCRTDADCDRAAGGICRAFMSACHSAGFACTYPEDPCLTDADCPGGNFPRICLPNQDGHGTQCVDDPPRP